jgi:CheY-like chemotaxis protein
MKPVHEEDLLGSLQRAGAPPDGDRPILVLDDDAKELKVAEKTLKRLGYRPVCIADAREGLKAAAMDPPAAVILDLLMPEMDGFAFLRSFRLTPAGRRTPVIVWTAKDVTAEERERLESSAQAIVLKSKGTAALVEELQAYVPLPQGDAHAGGGSDAR